MYLSYCNVKVFGEWDNVTSSVSKSWPDIWGIKMDGLDDRLSWVTSRVYIVHYF